MENYKKGKNVENPLDRKEILVDNLPEHFLWMQVRGGSKIRNLLTHALGELPESKAVVWSGYGPAVGKTITCAEIMKRKCGHTLHQVTKLCYRQVDEYWDPILPDLDQIIVKRKLPMIHIVLSRVKLNNDSLGYQCPGSQVAFKPMSQDSKHGEQNKKRNNYKHKNIKQEGTFKSSSGDIKQPKSSKSPKDRQ